MTKKQKAVRNLVYIILAILVVMWVFPIVWIVLTSFRAEGGQFVSYIIPKSFTLDHYKLLFSGNSSYPFPTWFRNTLLVSVCSCLLSTAITISMAYALSRIKFKMKNTILKAALVLNMFPAFMSMIAVYYILKALNLTQSLVSLVLIYSAGAALTFYIAKGFFDTVSFSMDESAMIDGATKYQIFTRITIPLAQPIIVYTALQAFISPWMDFIFAKVIMGDRIEKYTVAIGLYSMMTRDNADYLYMAFTAGCVLIAIPIVLLFIYLQKYYVEGITGGAVKG